MECGRHLVNLERLPSGSFLVQGRQELAIDAGCWKMKSYKTNIEEEVCMYRETDLPRNGRKQCRRGKTVISESAILVDVIDLVCDYSKPR